jgi:hypothetical protein
MNSVYKARTREQVLEGNLARKRSRFNGKVMSYTPVTEQNELQMVWQTANILTNIPMKFH